MPDHVVPADKLGTFHWLYSSPALLLLSLPMLRHHRRHFLLLRLLLVSQNNRLHSPSPSNSPSLFTS